MNRRFDIIGYPLGHSLSPQIHKRLFELADMPADYKLTEIKPEELENKFDYLRSLDGFNITIPHKIPIIRFCDRLDDDAARYGSVNCVKVGEECIGFNTDVVGFTKSIENLGAALCSKVCLVGCGGVGRMMAIEAARQGARLTIAVRDSDLATATNVMLEILKNQPENEVKVVPLSKVGGGYDLLINCTPVGMFPNTELMPLDAAQLEGVGFLFDAVYNPVETMLVRTAREMGITAASGMAMLVLQAVAAHEIWDGSKYNQADINQLIYDMEKLISQ